MALTVSNHAYTEDQQDANSDRWPSSMYDNASLKETICTDPKDIFPEGGRKAWLVVFGSWCALFISLGLMNTMGAFQQYLSTHQLRKYSVGEVGWIFSLYAFLTFGVSLFVGPLFDTRGPKWLILPGSVLVAMSMGLIGFCQDYWHFIITFSIFGGVGSALLFSPSIAIVGHYFDRRRGNATGIAATGGAIGGIVFPLVLQLLIPRIGFAWSTRIFSLIMTFLGILANLLITSRLSPSQTSNGMPSIHVFRNLAFTTTVFGVFLLELALFVPLTYISSYCLSQGFSPSFSFIILPILNAGSVLGRWLPGYYADGIGRYNAAILAISLTVLSVLGIWLPFGGSTAGIVLFAVLFGFASGSNISLTPVCISQLCPIEEYGRYYATCFSMVSLGCLTGVPIAGQILSMWHGSYDGLIMFIGFLYVGGLVGFLGARLKATGWVLRVKY